MFNVSPPHTHTNTHTHTHTHTHTAFNTELLIQVADQTVCVRFINKLLMIDQCIVVCPIKCEKTHYT